MISTQTPTRHEFQPHNNQFHLYLVSPLAQQSGFTWKWLYSLLDLHMKTIASSIKILTQRATNFSHKKIKKSTNLHAWFLVNQHCWIILFLCRIQTQEHAAATFQKIIPSLTESISTKIIQTHSYPRHCIQKKRMVVNHLMHTLGWTPKQTTII